MAARGRRIRRFRPGRQPASQPPDLGDRRRAYRVSIVSANCLAALRPWLVVLRNRRNGVRSTVRRWKRVRHSGGDPGRGGVTLHSARRGPSPPALSLSLAPPGRFHSPPYSPPTIPPAPPT